MFYQRRLYRRLIRRIQKMVFSGILISSLGLTAAADDSLEALKEGVVKIHSHMSEQADETGAGIVVRLDGSIAYILTAYHVVGEAESIEVEFHSDPVRRYEANVHRFDEALDIAVIYVDDERVPSELPTFSIGFAANLKEAAAVTAMGHQPGDLDWQLSPETITNENDPYDPRKFLFTKVGIDRGNSGGPIFMDGTLVGIVISKAPTLAVAVKIDYAMTYLDQWRVPPSQLNRPVFDAEPVDPEDPEPNSDEIAEAAGGVLMFQTKPATTQIFVDNKNMGSTQEGALTLERIDPGKHEVRVSKSGYNSWRDTVEVKENREIMISVELQRKVANSTVFTSPAIGEVILQPIRGAVLRTQASIEAECAKLVQGKMAWDYEGNKRWSDANIKRLCKGTSNASQPPRCFDRAMHGGRHNMGKAAGWTWSTALDLCEGTSDAARTLACFEGRIGRGSDQQAAIKACSK